jgi:DNA-directed RNA polymerase specialized sigma24 family protein
MGSHNPQTGSARGGRFATTHWSVIAAAQDGSSPEARAALAALCSAYWYPLYVFIRGQGHPADEAQDLTQGFFTALLERKALAVADPARGKFRSFLLGACKHYLSHERGRVRAQKRGGGRKTVSLDFGDAEARYSREPAHTLTPDRLFARRWAMTLLDQVLFRLRQEFAAKGKQTLFDHLRVCLLGDKNALPHAQVALELRMSEGSVKVAAHRLRGRFRDLVREEIARTVNQPGDIEDEIRELFAALASQTA